MLKSFRGLSPGGFFYQTVRPAVVGDAIRRFQCFAEVLVDGTLLEVRYSFYSYTHRLLRIYVCLFALACSLYLGFRTSLRFFSQMK